MRAISSQRLRIRRDEAIPLGIVVARISPASLIQQDVRSNMAMIRAIVWRVILMGLGRWQRWRIMAQVIASLVSLTRWRLRHRWPMIVKDGLPRLSMGTINQSKAQRHSPIIVVIPSCKTSVGITRPIRSQPVQVGREQEWSVLSSMIVVWLFRRKATRVTMM